METMRTIGTLGIKPITFAWMGHCGTPGRRGDTASFLAKPLAQNLVWACYHQARSLEEIATELGVSPVYLGPELAELEEAMRAGNREETRHELGDLLFAAVNLGRHLDLDAEESLDHTIGVFIDRFSHIEREVARRGGSLGETPLEEMERLWQEAKALGR